MAADMKKTMGDRWLWWCWRYVLVTQEEVLSPEQESVCDAQVHVEVEEVPQPPPPPPPPTDEAACLSASSSSLPPMALSHRPVRLESAVLLAIALHHYTGWAGYDQNR